MRAVASRDKNGKITVRLGRYVEGFDGHLLNREQIRDHIRWIAVTAGYSLPDSLLDNLTDKAMK